MKSSFFLGIRCLIIFIYLFQKKTSLPRHWKPGSCSCDYFMQACQACIPCDILFIKFVYISIILYPSTLNMIKYNMYYKIYNKMLLDLILVKIENIFLVLPRSKSCILSRSILNPGSNLVPGRLLCLTCNLDPDTIFLHFLLGFLNI